MYLQTVRSEIAISDVLYLNELKRNNTFHRRARTVPLRKVLQINCARMCFQFHINYNLHDAFYGKYSCTSHNVGTKGVLPFFIVGAARPAWASQSVVEELLGMLAKGCSVVLCNSCLRAYN
jgi:hypothetical protein